MTTQIAGSTPTGNTYDKYATTNSFEQRMMRGFMRALDEMTDGLTPRRILEIGVGEGHVMTRVRERFPGVPLVGLDLPDDDLGADWRAKGLPCMFGDATTLPFPDDSFDLVLAIEVLEHVPMPDHALSELSRVCSGTFVAVGPVRADLAGRQHRAPPLRQGARQHPRPRQPLEPLGLPQVRRDPVPRPAGPQPAPLDDDQSHPPLKIVFVRILVAGATRIRTETRISDANRPRAGGPSASERRTRTAR